jgi:hypothetical protein
MRKLAFLALLFVSCPPTAPTPVATTPPPAITCSAGANSILNCGTGNGNGAAPSPSPNAGPFAKPDYVKITQFGETCPAGIEPSGQDRSVRIGCSKALTLSPKCHQVSGPDIDCPVPQDAAPDSFFVSAGADHIDFSLSASSKFNRDAKGKTAGQAIITGAYAGVRAQDDFVLTVIP